jgi:O-antigen/teichoic acid export membrane protein
MTLSIDTQDGIKQRYAQAALYSGVWGAAGQVLYGLSPALVARHLSPSDYGVYAVVMSMVGIAVGIFSLGQHSILHKMLPQYLLGDPERGRALLANTIILTGGALFIFCGLSFLVAETIANLIYGDSSLSNIFRFCALLMFFLPSFALAASVVAGLQDFRSYNLIVGARSLLLLLLIWLGVAWQGIYGALAAQLLAALAGASWLTITAYKLVRRRLDGRLRPVFSKSLLAEMGGFALPVLLMTVLNLPGLWLTSALLARTEGFAEVGWFSVAYMLAQLILLLPLNLYTPAMTFMAEAQTAGAAVFGQLVSDNLRLIWAVTLPIALGCALFAPMLINLVFGVAYAPAAPLAFLLSIAALFMLNTGLLNTAITAAGRAWHGCAIAAIWAVVFVGGNLFLIPRWGARGAALVFLATQALYFAMTYFYSRRILLVNYRKLGQLLLLSLVGFSIAAILPLLSQGMQYYLMASLLLIGVIILEWLWVSEATERARSYAYTTRFVAYFQNCFGCR